MSRLTDLIAQAKKQDPRLGAALEQEFHSRTQRTFGLVFERHLPEKVELPGRPVRRGDIVHVLPERGTKQRENPRTWRVITTRKDDATGRVAQLVEATPTAGTEPELLTRVPVSDLVVVAQQNDVIYPGLRQTGEVIGSNDTDAPFHSVINAENYHALKMLTYTHYHKVDCIYIDPPYNTGAKDWKYNNDYVDGNDAYRHSKWLSFMERRLLVAKQLLNPNDSVLIVTIDEKEYLRLGMLLEQTFPEARIQMVSSMINKKGSTRPLMFSRSDEYIFYCFIGDAAVTMSSDNMMLPTSDLDEAENEAPKVKKITIWNSLLRRGTDALRVDRPNLFYPIWVDPETKKIIGVGDSLPLDAPRTAVVRPDDVPESAVMSLPIRKNDVEGRWQVGQTTLLKLISEGRARGGAFNVNTQSYSVVVIKDKQMQQISEGVLTVTGQEPSGALRVVQEIQPDTTNTQNARTLWVRDSHDASVYGTTLLSSFLPRRKFPFPKSLYAVEDTLRFAVGNKPDATVLDFFSGSGTTAHAVMRLNKQDGGRRRSISVTNNEVGVDEQKKLRAQGLRPGEAEWEQWGICDYVTKPRIRAAITGKTPEGKPIKGDYKFTDEFPMADGFEANARFFTLTYEPPTRVRHGYAFAEIAPMLWLRAGQTGRIITEIPDRGWDIAESYGVIENVAASKQFLDAVNHQGGVKVIYIVTNDDLVFESMAREMAETDAELVRLYATYLNNFAFQQARENNN